MDPDCFRLGPYLPFLFVKELRLACDQRTQNVRRTQSMMAASGPTEDSVVTGGERRENSRELARGAVWHDSSVENVKSVSVLQQVLLGLFFPL